MYRCHDPSTSREAALSVNALHLEGLVYEWLSSQGLRGGTSEEIGRALGLPRDTISPRIAPLRRKGLVYDSSSRRQGHSGRKQIVWVAQDLSFLN